jgi:hypothetical protein
MVVEGATTFSAARLRMSWSRPGMMRFEVGLWPGLETWKDRVRCAVKQELSHHVGGDMYEVLVLTNQEYEIHAAP